MNSGGQSKMALKRQPYWNKLMASKIRSLKYITIFYFSSNIVVKITQNHYFMPIP